MSRSKILFFSFVTMTLLLFLHGLQRVEEGNPSVANATTTPATVLSSSSPSGCQTDSVILSLATFFEGAMKYHKVESFHLIIGGQGENLIQRRLQGGFEACSVFEHNHDAVHLQLPLAEEMNGQMVAVLKANPSVQEVHIPVIEGEVIIKPYPWTREYVFSDGCPKACPNPSDSNVFHYKVIVQEAVSSQDNDHGP